LMHLAIRRLQVVLLACLFALALASGGASAQQTQARLALLIGNQAYNAEVGALKNPHNDIALIGAALDKLGFKTKLIREADYKTRESEKKRHIKNGRKEGEGTISSLYYPGPGAADPDTNLNYLIRVDVISADDEEFGTSSITLNTIIGGLRGLAPAATHYVV